MSETLKLASMGLLYLLTGILGIILSKQKKPYVFFTFTMHKLSSLSYAILFIVFVCTSIHDKPTFLPCITFITALVFIIMSNITGIIQTPKKQYSHLIRNLHILFIIMTPLLSALSFILVL